MYGVFLQPLFHTAPLLLVFLKMKEMLDSISMEPIVHTRNSKK
jgi:hypothetical protein